MKHQSIIFKKVVLYAGFAFFSLLIHSCNTLQNGQNITGTVNETSDSSALNSDRIENSEQEQVTEKNDEDDDQPLGLNDQD
jgi:hypothetical protein